MRVFPALHDALDEIPGRVWKNVLLAIHFSIQYSYSANRVAYRSSERFAFLSEQQARQLAELRIVAKEIIRIMSQWLRHGETG